MQELPWGARILYLQGLRRYMDYQTGLVGSGGHTVSWQGLTAVLYQAPHRGMSGLGPVTKSQVRRLNQWLIKAGLVEMRSDEEAKQLIFFLPLADMRQSVQKKADTKPTLSRHLSRHTEIIGDSGLEDESRHTQKNRDAVKPTHIQETGNRNKEIDVVFEYWKAVTGHSRARLDDKRKRLIGDRLKDYSVEELCIAIDGNKASPFHQGKNEDGTVHDSIELIFRSAGNVERFIGIAEKPKTNKSCKAGDFDWMKEVGIV